jgi:hypothetical protein
MICWMWAFDFASDAHVMYSYAIGSFEMYMHVDGLFLWKMLYIILSCGLNAFHVQIVRIWHYLA